MPEFGERERDVGVRVTIIVDIDPVDPAGVESRFHQERRHGTDACRVGINVDNQCVVRLASLGAWNT